MENQKIALAVMAISSRMILDSTLDWIIINLFEHPDKKSVQDWAMDSLRRYAEMRQKQMERGSYDAEDKAIQELLNWLMEQTTK